LIQINRTDPFEKYEQINNIINRLDETLT